MEENRIWEERFQDIEIVEIDPDISALQEISGGDIEFENEILKLFLQEAPAVLFEIDLAFQNNDIRRLKSVLHKFKSSINMIGKAQLLKIVLEIEQKLKLAENINTEDVADEVTELLAACLGILRHISHQFSVE